MMRDDRADVRRIQIEQYIASPKLSLVELRNTHVEWRSTDQCKLNRFHFKLVQHHCQYDLRKYKLANRVIPIVEQLPTRMWANAQPDGRPAEHRWRPLFNAPKVWLTPTTIDAVQ